MLKLFFYKPKEYDSIIFVISMIDDPNLFSELESLTHDIFHILITMNYADDTNIIIFSIIKNYTESTINLILPAINSNLEMVNKLSEQTQDTNNIIVKILENNTSDFNLEITDTEIIVDKDKTDLKILGSYYTLCETC